MEDLKKMEDGPELEEKLDQLYHSKVEMQAREIEKTGQNASLSSLGRRFWRDVRRVNAKIKVEKYQKALKNRRLARVRNNANALVEPFNDPPLPPNVVRLPTNVAAPLPPNAAHLPTNVTRLPDIAAPMPPTVARLPSSVVPLPTVGVIEESMPLATRKIMEPFGKLSASVREVVDLDPNLTIEEQLSCVESLFETLKEEIRDNENVCLRNREAHVLNLKVNARNQEICEKNESTLRENQDIIRNKKRFLKVVMESKKKLTRKKLEADERILEEHDREFELQSSRLTGTNEMKDEIETVGDVKVERKETNDTNVGDHEKWLLRPSFSSWTRNIMCKTRPTES